MSGLEGKPDSVQVLIVDSCPIIRSGLRELIDAQPGLRTIGEADGFAAALSTIAKLQPQLIILDICLGSTPALDLSREIYTHWPGLPWIVYTTADENLYAQRIIRAGGRGYVMKHESPQVLLSAIGAVLDGEVFVSKNMVPNLLRQMVGRRTPAHQSPLEGLSDRELEVLNLMGLGFNARTIAERLCISPRTVETYEEHLKRKLAIATRNALLQYAIANQAATASSPRPPNGDTSLRGGAYDKTIPSVDE